MARKEKGAYRVVRSLDVDATIREILQRRIENSGLLGANKLLDSFEHAFSPSSVFPFMGRLADDKVLKTKGYRKVNVAEFIVLYHVESLTSRVIIAHVYHHRENLEGLI